MKLRHHQLLLVLIASVLVVGLAHAAIKSAAQDAGYHDTLYADSIERASTTGTLGVNGDLVVDGDLSAQGVVGAVGCFDNGCVRCSSTSTSGGVFECAYPQVTLTDPDTGNRLTRYLGGGHALTWACYALGASGFDSYDAGGSTTTASYQQDSRYPEGGQWFSGSGTRTSRLRCTT